MMHLMHMVLAVGISILVQVVEVSLVGCWLKQRLGVDNACACRLFVWFLPPQCPKAQTQVL